MIYSHINSKDNQLIKLVAKLAKNAEFRHEQQKAVIYGRHLIEEALLANNLNCVLISEDSLNNYADIIDNLNSKQIYVIKNTLFNKFDIADSHIDIVALINFSEANMLDDIYGKDCILLENIQDPGNLGAILRVARAGNIQNILLSKSCVDVYNPKVLRASQGMQFGLNIITDVDLIAFANKYNGNMIATNPRGESAIYQIDFTINTAMFFGNEGNGLTKELLECIHNVRIPMLGNSESLNLAMSVTICVFEMVRQRCI